MPRAAVVCGLGSYLPEAVLSNDMLAAELDTSDAWISSRTGVRQRHIAGDLGSDGHQFDLLMTPAVSRAERSSGQASNYFRMDGKAVFGQAVTQMSDSVRRVLDRVGWQASDLHHLVPHQANTRILAAVADQLDLPVERVVSNIAEVGNTVAASIPLALAHGLRQGILRDGGNMVLTGFGAGLTWGSVALRWPKIVPTMD